MNTIEDTLVRLWHGLLIVLTISVLIAFDNANTQDNNRYKVEGVACFVEVGCEVVDFSDRQTIFDSKDECEKAADIYESQIYLAATMRNLTPYSSAINVECVAI